MRHAAASLVPFSWLGHANGAHGVLPLLQHMGLFACLFWGQIGVQARKQGYFDVSRGVRKCMWGCRLGAGLEDWCASAGSAGCWLRLATQPDCLCRQRSFDLPPVLVAVSPHLVLAAPDVRRPPS